MKISEAQDRLIRYRAALVGFRREAGTPKALPPLAFFLFGMGARRKLIYQDGVLKDGLTGEILHRWDVVSEVILPDEYTVVLDTRQRRIVQIVEDEKGVWLVEGEQRTALSQSPLRLPTFAEHKHGLVLRVLHHEILVNIINGLPVPNFFVYRKPWYRDAALMAMALKETGNLNLVSDWILGLADPFDHNNAGETEADNLGQALYLISLVSDASHPLVPVLSAQLVRFQKDNHILGRSDFAEHPVYQTKWAKFGLRALGLPDPYEIPRLPDSYSALFWWDFQDQHVEGPRFSEENYPYLEWAEANFYNEPGGSVGDRDYPLSWEANASQADYPALKILSSWFVEKKICAPHTWHAAEMFLYLLRKQ